MRRNENMKDVTLSVMVVIDLSPTWLSHFNMVPQHDFHAGFSETSVMMYWAGDKVRMDELAYDEKELLEGMRTDPDWYANIDKKVDSPYVIPFVYQKPEVKVGVMGFPEMATREIGEQICREVADSIVKYVDMLNEKNG